MVFAWNYLFVLIWIAYLISSGVFLFSRGFLLSRVSKQDFSTCRLLSNDPNEDYHLNEDLVQEIFKDVNASTANLCLPKKSKVVILVIDALKYEFGLYNPDLDNPLPFENRINIFNELLTAQPDHSRLLKFRADPPTTTLQRLKGLTTGSLPTFIDIGSNFATPEINEDNIIDQIIRNRLSAVFLGDSTWTELYPKRFKRQYSYPSFDIFDLDTVDSEILKNLPSELEKSDWDVLIAHFLGIDHCGHRYGPLHEEMTRKLTELDGILRKVIDKMDNETTLLVIGDHGMTGTGDHGGESEDELNALLFAYSKSHKFITSDYGSDNVTMQQIDLVPTLSSILGIPIPYSNLGLINFNILPDTPVPHMTKYQTLLLHAWQNAKQIYKYFYNYALDNKRSFNLESMDSLESQFLILTHRVNTIYNELAFKNFMKDLNAHLRNILDVCRDIWVKFDANQMSQGLLLTFLPIFFSFLLINNSKPIQLANIFTSSAVGFIYLVNFAAGVFAYRYFKKLSMKTEEHSVLFVTNIVSTVMLAILTLQNWPQIAVNWSNTKRFSNVPTRCIFLISASVFFSNSFIIEEQKILSYLLIAVVILTLYELTEENNRFRLKTKFRLMPFLKSLEFGLIVVGVVTIILLRLAYNFFQCREEQGNCGDFLIGGSVKKTSRTHLYMISVIVLLLYTTLTRIYLRSCGNLTGFSINVMLARYGPTVAAVCAGGHMLLTNSRIKNVNPSQIDAMALVIYAMFLLQIIIIFVYPLMTYVLPRRNPTTITVNPSGNVIPEIFKKMKSIYEGDQKDQRGEIPVVYGLATIYSSVLISFGVFLAIVIAVLLDAKASLGFAICIAVGAALLALHAILRYRTATNLESCCQPTFTAVVSWYLLSQFCFYATSHQPTMSQINWRAAFVGRSANFDHSNFISGTLVLFNTFCGQIFFLTLYGLLNTEMFALYALFPSLLRRKTKEKKSSSNYSDIRETIINKNDWKSDAQLMDFDITRGDLVLYENEHLFIGSLLKLATQIFMLQGIKVFCSMMACTIHCRHLMVWKIFAPRFIYEGLATFISLPAIIFGYLILIRVHWSVSRMINRINKTK